MATHEVRPGGTTIRAAQCAFLTEDPRGRCSVCCRYRTTLHAMLHRATQQRPVSQSQSAKASPTNPTSTVNLRYLSTPEKVRRFRRLRLSFRRSQAQVDRLQAKLSAVVEERSAVVDEEVHGDLVTIMQENKAQVLLLLIMAIVHVICKARHIVRFYFMHIIMFVLSCQKMRGCSKWALDPFLY